MPKPQLGTSQTFYKIDTIDLHIYFFMDFLKKCHMVLLKGKKAGLNLLILVVTPSEVMV